MKMMTGKKITELRKKCGYTPRRLAELMEISVEELKMYESGKLPVSDELLKSFSDALRSCPDELTGYRKPSTGVRTRLTDTEYGRMLTIMLDGLEITSIDFTTDGSIRLLLNEM